MATKTITTAQEGFYWHVHHDKLVEWCWDYWERIKYIYHDKPNNELYVRLERFQPVNGRLPPGVIQAGQAYDQARQAAIQAGQAAIQAGQAYDQAIQAAIQARQAYDQAIQASVQAVKLYDQAIQAYDQVVKATNQAGKAFQKSVARNLPAIEVLHRAECPDCPWDGSTILREGQHDI